MSIRLSVLLREDLDSSEIKVDGFELFPLNDDTAKVFGIPRQITAGHYNESRHGKLWGAINQKHGRYPNEFVTSDPVIGSGLKGVPNEWTPYADSWGVTNQVQVQRKAVGARLVRTTGGIDAMATSAVKNYTDRDQPLQQTTLSYTEQVQDSRSNEKHWSIALTNSLEVSVEGSYGGFKAGMKRSIALTVEGGGSTTKTHTVTKGNTISRTVTVNAAPRTIYPVSIQAGKGSLEVEVTYEYTLSGQWRPIYFRPYNGSAFGPIAEINELLGIMNLPTKVTDADTIEVGFVTDGSTAIGKGMPVDS